MLRYIIQKNVNNDYCHGYVTIMEHGKPKTFMSKQLAYDWLMKNDKDFATIPLKELAKFYVIKPYIV